MSWFFVSSTSRRWGSRNIRFFFDLLYFLKGDASKRSFGCCVISSSATLAPALLAYLGSSPWNYWFVFLRHPKKSWGTAYLRKLNHRFDIKNSVFTSSTNSVYEGQENLRTFWRTKQSVILSAKTQHRQNLVKFFVTLSDTPTTLT